MEMSDNETTDLTKYDPSSGYSMEQWGAMADLAAMGQRLKAILPGGGKLKPWEAIGVAQYAKMQGANPFRGEIYGYSDKHGFHLVEGYKLLVRWAKGKCDYSEWYTPIDEDKLPEPGAIGYTIHILRADKHDLLDKLLTHGMDVDRVMDIVTTTAGGVVRKQEQTTRSGSPAPPPSGWTWHDVAKKRALKNGLNRSHGAPSPGEVAAESWNVNGTQTQARDWDGTAEMPQTDRELEAEYKARARVRKEKRDDSKEAGTAVAELFGDDAGHEYVEGVTEEPPHDRGPEWSPESGVHDGNGRVGYEAEPTETHEWTLAESDKLCAWGRERTLGADSVLAALGVDRLTEYPGNLADAKDAITKWIAKQTDKEQAQAEMSMPVGAE